MGRPVISFILEVKFESEVARILVYILSKVMFKMTEEMKENIPKQEFFRNQSIQELKAIQTLKVQYYCIHCSHRTVFRK